MNREAPGPDRGEIQLGDLARALRTLNGQDDAEAQAIARSLDFGIKPKAAPKFQTEIYNRQQYPARAVARPKGPSPQEFTASPEPETAIELPDQRLFSQLKPLGRRASPRPQKDDWLSNEPAFYDSQTHPVVGRATLFPEVASHNIVAAALATQREGCEIDVHALVSKICRLNAIRRIPRLPEATLERGCQLLLDYSATMVPFWGDLNDLQEKVQQVLGEENLEVFSFDRQPADAQRWTSRGELIPWSPSRRPVLMATDLGIQGMAGEVQVTPSLLDLAAQCEADGSPLLVLVPWSRERWPILPGGYSELIHWSNQTTAAMIVQKVGLGHRITS